MTILSESEFSMMRFNLRVVREVNLYLRRKFVSSKEDCVNCSQDLISCKNDCLCQHFQVCCKNVYVGMVYRNVKLFR